MKSFYSLTAALLATAALSGCSMWHHDQQPQSTHTSMTHEFVTQASIGDMFEIQSSKLALSKSPNADVRKLARHMIDDHTKSSANLKATLASTNTSARPATMLDNDHQAMLNDLKSSSKADFDSKYLEAQENAHNDAIALFENYSASGKNADLRNFANQTLPVLKMHKNHVDALESRM